MPSNLPSTVPAALAKLLIRPVCSHHLKLCGSDLRAVGRQPRRPEGVPELHLGERHGRELAVGGTFGGRCVRGCQHQGQENCSTCHGFAPLVRIVAFRSAKVAFFGLSLRERPLLSRSERRPLLIRQSLAARRAPFVPQARDPSVTSREISS